MQPVLIEDKLRGKVLSITGDQIIAGEFLIHVALKTESEKTLFFDPASIYSEEHVRAQNPALAKNASRITVARPLKDGRILPLLLAIRPTLVIASAANNSQTQELKAYARLHNAAVFLAGSGGDVEYAV
jgi:hypothetical protein